MARSVPVHGVAPLPPAEQQKPQECNAAPAYPRVRRHWTPRVDVVLLAGAFALTAGAKLLAARNYEVPLTTAALGAVVLSDVSFFLAAAAGVMLLPRGAGRRWSALVATLIGIALAAWAMLNAAWLVITGVQLQVGALAVILRHPSEFWPTVRQHVAGRPLLVALIALGGVAGLVWAAWQVAQPGGEVSRWKRRIWRAAVAGLLALACGLGQRAVSHLGMIPSVGEALTYSSHWEALTGALGIRSEGDGLDGAERVVARRGERRVRLPDAARGAPPNVVLVLLESVSYKAREAGTPEFAAMPVLAGLAAAGAEFANTRVPVSQTGKAFWTVLSGTTPDVYSDFAEALLVDEPYEGLPTLLGRLGHRSAFFEMSKGSFECAPGLFANFGFDWAWFRENLEDPTADLGYLAGDDFRLLDPAFEWVRGVGGPFFLMLITSATHDPYEVPAWFEAPATGGDHAKYVQTLRYTDAFLGELLRRLDEQGLRDDTLLCVLGDHGDSFRAESRKNRWVPYEEVLRVPWIIRWPGHVSAGARYDWPCSQLDVAPTLLTLMGFDVSAAEFDGRDARTPADPARRLHFASWYPGSPAGYVEGVRKYVYWPQSGRVFAFDLAGDPLERDGVAMDGAAREQVISEVQSWTRASYLSFPATRFRKQFLYEHWWAFSSGRYGRAYYVP
jgi:hypothetical protein